MARKKAPPAPARPTRDRVFQCLARGEVLTAAKTARELHQLEPTAEHLALLKQTLVGAGAQFALKDEVVSFGKLMDEADALDPADPEWTIERACLLARGGRLAEALMRVDDAGRLKVLGHAADRSLRINSKDFLPDDLHAGFDAILSAFRLYESGQDDAARTALEAVSLRSPFLEWKVLLRGLMAHAAGEDARAVENFERLDPSRIPAQVAAPYRAAVDEPWKATLPPAIAAGLDRTYEKLNPKPFQEKLREIARLFGRDRPLTPIFRLVEQLLPELRRTQPALVPRLANCLYYAIRQQGEPPDLPRYEKLFGNPPHDPYFHKLQALITEAIPDWELCHTHWKRHIEWLESNPPGWPADVLKRAQSMIWHRMGVNAVEALRNPSDFDDENDLFFDMFGPKKRKKKAKPLDPGPTDCYRLAYSLAPDWGPPAYDLFDVIKMTSTKQAESVARRFLEHHPEDLRMLGKLADLYSRVGQTAESLELSRRILAVNPLDRSNRERLAGRIQAHARQLAIDGDSTAAIACFEENAEVLKDHPTLTDALRAVILEKLGQADAAAAIRASIVAHSTVRLAVTFQMSVDVQLIKLKPAVRKQYIEAFTAELERTPRPLEVFNLLRVYKNFLNDGISYRGQKGQERTFLALALRSVDSDADEQEFEELGYLLLERQAFKVLKSFTERAFFRFTKNPIFLMLRSEAGLALSEDPYPVEDRLRIARGLAEKSREPRFRAILPRIEELLRSVASPFEMLQSFFRRR